MDENDTVDRPSLVRQWFSWRPTSQAQLKDAESILLSKLTIVYKTYFINISEDNVPVRVRCIMCEPEVGNKSSNAAPLVMLHGFASGIGLWILNLKELSANRRVYAIDLLGFGRSSRPRFPKSAEDIEEYFVKSIDVCVEKIGLNKFILLGHSFGAFLAAAYSLRHADKLFATLLCDPWGFPERPADADELSWAPTWKRKLISCLIPYNPLAGVRATGPMGPRLVRRFRRDIGRKYEGVLDSKDLFAYIYHCNAQEPSGETAFRRLTIPVGWAKNPMITRIKDIDKELPLYMIHGANSWIHSSMGYRIQSMRAGSMVKVEIIENAGHHIYSDQAEDFNALVNRICHVYDSSTSV